jgi:hypothetical protein
MGRPAKALLGERRSPKTHDAALNSLKPGERAAKWRHDVPGEADRVIDRAFSGDAPWVEMRLDSFLDVTPEEARAWLYAIEDEDEQTFYSEVDGDGRFHVWTNEGYVSFYLDGGLWIPIDRDEWQYMTSRIPQFTQFVFGSSAEAEKEGFEPSLPENRGGMR